MVRPDSGAMPFLFQHDLNTDTLGTEMVLTTNVTKMHEKRLTSGFRAMASGHAEAQRAQRRTDITVG